MAFRDNAYNPVCRVCERVADQVCPRCNGPLCSDHAPAPNQRCDDCERDYLALVNEDRSLDWSEVAMRWGVGSMCAAFWVLGYACLTKSHVFLALSLLALLSALGGYPLIRCLGPVVERLHSSHRRQLFLRERKLLPP